MSARITGATPEQLFRAWLDSNLTEAEVQLVARWLVPPDQRIVDAADLDLVLTCSMPLQAEIDDGMLSPEFVAAHGRLTSALNGGER